MEPLRTGAEETAVSWIQRLETRSSAIKRGLSQNLRVCLQGFDLYLDQSPTSLGNV